jgi:PhnB protein
MQVQPSVFFDGRCEEALRFYGEKLGAEVLFQMRYKDSPPDPKRSVLPGSDDKITHATIRIGTTELMMSDHCNSGNTAYAGFNLSLTTDNAADGEQFFNTLADGGQVRMPWQSTFWTKGFGMVADRFGIGWMVTIPREG